MSAPRTSDCRKFSPNIFNKSKCSHCFRQREEHSAAALECNRASRKVSKCGYLFVAPDWDFSNPLYRTKRWQRRWFVLYDDGELTYSVDEHPETVPQACIDMTKVLEVTTAEDVTGNTNSIAITAPDRVTFVKGTCPEESKWWLNILAAFPKSKGRHKRNATFPGGQATTILQTNSDSGSGSTTRNRHNSYHKDALTSAQSAGVLIGSPGGVGGGGGVSVSIGSSSGDSDESWQQVGRERPNNVDADDDDVDDDDDDNENVDDDDEDDGVETGEDEEDEQEEEEMNVADEKKAKNKSKVSTNSGGQDENNRNAGNEITNRVSAPSTCLLIEDIRRDEKTIKDIANTITNLSQQQKSRWSTTTVNNVLNSHLQTASRDETDFGHRQQQQQPTQTTIVSLRPKSLPLASNSTPAIVSAIVKKIPPVMVNNSSNNNQNNNTNNHNNNNNNNNNNMNNMSGDSNNNNPLNNNIRCKSSPRLQLQLKHLQQQHQLQQQQQHQQNNQQQQLKRHQSREKPMQTHERGDPDGGCNLDDLSTSCYLAKTAELRVNVPLEEATAKSGATTTGSTTKAAKTTSVTASTSSSSSPPCSVLNEKKGWLMKQDNRTGDWTKHWFTLSGAALFYYRDPVSEERGVLDGVLDVNSLTSVSAEVVGGANKNYAFQLITWDKRRLTLASLSPNSRLSWIALLRQAAGLQTAPTAPTTTTATPMDPAKPASVSVEDDDIKSEIEKDFIKAQRSQELLIGGYQEANNNSTSTPSSSSSMIGSKNKLSETSPQVLLVNGGANNANSANNSTAATTTTTAKPTALSPVTPSTPKTPGGHFSSDEEYRTASEGGRRDSVDWGSPLSPSPPLPLSLSSLLRAKDRMRPRTTQCPSLHKRSRSSPPSSRRSTVDSVGSDELPPSIRSQTVHEELLHIDQELKFRLSVAEKERDMLRDEAKEREARMSELLTTLERTEQELTARIQEMEAARDHLSAQLGEAKRNAEKIIGRLTEELQESHKNIKSLEDRLSRGIEENETLYKRMRELENDSPSSFGHHHHHPLQLNLNLTRSKLKRMDSLSDLTHINDIDPYGLERDHLAEEYNELRSRFEKAVNEIRAMKRELKESQNQFDSLEISYASLKQDLERRELEDRSQLQMMAERIQDLTLKYSGSERQVRLLKQKLAKSERRRSLSLKGGKEQLSISKELELKVADLETKLDEWEKATTAIISTSSVITATAVTPSPTTTSSVRSSQGTEGGPKQQQKKSSRRRSLESSASADSLQFMVRVNDLEKRLEGVSGCSTPTPPGLESPRCPSSSCSTTSSTSCSNSASPSPKASEHLLKRLRCLEGVLIASKDRLEQSLQQLQTLRSTRTRRSVSPITDRKDSYRLVERCLGEVVKLLRESCDSCIIAGSLAAFPPPTGALIALPESSPIKAALVQLETQLRTKLADLLKQRRVLRERNELTSSKDLELLAERVAFESVCFGKLRDSVTRAENPQLFGERQTRAEVAETSHLITMLKAKLSGKCSFKPSGSVDILAGVLARRLVLSGYRKDIATTPTTTPSSKLEPVDPNILEDLRRQQNELNLIAKRYKNHAMENLASGLAAETLSYISSNDLVQGAVQEAWRQAQETVNAELVQSEIAHIMMRHAERFEYAVQPSFGYTLTAEERLTFENFADAVHEALRKEMELAVAQLTHCYEEAIQTMKRGQWRLHLEQERKASEGRQLLAEFADIVAHKALVDARIAVLCGAEPAPRSITIGDDANDDVDDASKDGDSKDLRQRRLGITALQRYESLFEELSSDLQISHPDDILAEADFEFLYRQQTLDFLSDRQVLAEISTFLGQLEDSLIALQCEAVSTTSVARSAISIESLQDVCRKCCDLRQRADQLLQDVQRKLQAPCPHCLQVREKLYAAQQQHDADVQRLQQTHAEDVAQLRQQLENQRNAIKSLEAEREEFDERMREQEERVERRQDELRAVEQKLRQREDELQSEQRERREQLERRLGEQDEKMRAFREESDALAMKCARQDEEYAVLLQERDYLQAELEKERERSRRFEKRLEMLELEHGKQLECLQEAYREQILSHCSDFPNITDEESFRQRYQAEIEQLKKLCEKGLSAMESSHRRIISDLEEKHRQEIERLLIEKETALAEETQATLAALDAMRKAHQSEVQREVARFKQEFLHQFQKGEHTPDAARIKEEELEELRREILSFSEKYSIKCVENAALEEKLRAVNQKLKHFQQMQQLELRNKQFRAHLASDDPLTDAAFVQGLNASKDDATCPDSEPVKHAIEMRMECDNKLKLKPRPQQQVQENHLKHTPDNNTKTRLQQSFFVIPSASLLRPATISAPVVRGPSKDDDRDHGGDDNSEKQDAANDAADNDNDNVNDNDNDDGGGGIDNDDDHDDAADDDRATISDDDSIYRYSYEPCYKQNNLYSYQNRISFEGLKSSTFGKNLKTITKSLKTAKTTTKPTKTAIPTTAANTTTKTPTPTTSSPASSKVLSNQLFKNTATIKINASRNAAKTNATTNSIPTTTTATITKEATEQMNYNYYKQYLQKQQLQQKQQKCSLTTEALTTNPVEEPKNINLNKTINNTKNNQYIHNNNHNNNNIIINPNNNCNNKSYNLIEHEEKQQKQAETFKIVNFNINNNNHTTTTATTKTTTSNLNNKTSVNKTLAATPTTATATCLKVAEKTAISLESFADIIKKTVNEQQQQQQQQKLQQLTTVENAKDDDDDVGDDDDVVNDDDDQKKQQQQQRQPSYNNSSGSTAKTIGSSANTQQQQLPRSGQPCSRPPLSGRDDEQQQFVATGSSAPTSPLRRFELEI